MFQGLYSRGVGGRDLECPAVRQLEPAAGQTEAPGGRRYYRYIYISTYLHIYRSISVPGGDAQLAPRHPPQLGLEPRDRGLARVGGEGEHYVAILSSYCHRVITVILS